jgi:mRNA interferase MazF
VSNVRTGEIWLAELDPTIGHQQGGRRPVVVVSSNGLHALPINMVVVVPLTSHDRGLVTQPRISGSESGLRQTSFARPEDMRAIDATRLQRRLGRISNEDLAEIRKVVRYVLDL